MLWCTQEVREKTRQVDGHLILEEKRSIGASLDELGCETGLLAGYLYWHRRLFFVIGQAE